MRHPSVHRRPFWQRPLFPMRVCLAVAAGVLAGMASGSLAPGLAIFVVALLLLTSLP